MWLQSHRGETPLLDHVRESLRRGPCTPFDPAPLGLALHEAQGEELVSTPVFITAGLKRTIRTKYKQWPRCYRKVSPLLGPSCSRLGFQSTSKLLWHPWPIYTTGRTFTFVTKFNWSQKTPGWLKISLTDQERGKIGLASLLQSWHWVLLCFESSLEGVKWPHPKITLYNISIISSSFFQSLTPLLAKQTNKLCNKLSSSVCSTSSSVSWTLSSTLFFSTSLGESRFDKIWTAWKWFLEKFTGPFGS